MIKTSFNNNNPNDQQKSIKNPSTINPHSLATSRRSAFSPYRPTTVLTNLQRGNIQTQTSNEPLYRSVHQLAALGELFLCNLDNKLVNEIDEKGFTPILWASAYGQVAAVNLLHRHGAQIHFKGPNGENALMLAAANGHLQVVKMLLFWGISINDVDEEGNTALMFAVNGNHKTCVKELLSNGADMTLENNNLDTAYTIAINKKFKPVQELLETHILTLLNS